MAGEIQKHINVQAKLIEGDPALRRDTYFTIFIHEHYILPTPPPTLHITHTHYVSPGNKQFALIIFFVQWVRRLGMVAQYDTLGY